MIDKKTAERIYNCHREIEVAENLLQEVKEIRQRYPIDGVQGLEDNFGRKQGLELGVPSGNNAHRLFSVPWEMAEPIIMAHISNQKNQLEALFRAAYVSLSNQLDKPVSRETDDHHPFFGG